MTESPTPYPQIDALLAEVAPTLGLDQEVLARMDAPAIDNVYELIDGLADCIPRDDDHDERFFALVKTVIRAQQNREDLAGVLQDEGYIVQTEDLPAIVEYISSWLCVNLVEVVVAVKEQAQLSDYPTRQQKPSKPKPGVRQRKSQKQKNDQHSSTNESRSLYPYPFEYRRLGNGKPDLLRKDEEVALAKIIEAGVLAEERLEHMGPAPHTMSVEEAQLREDLQTIIYQGKKALSFFVEANVRLAAEVAKGYVEWGVSYEDLKQIGTIMLVHAVEMFDYTAGYKFSSYATKWLNQAMRRATKLQGRTIVVPMDVHDELKKLKETRRTLKHDLGRLPTANELSKETNFSLEKIRLLQNIGKKDISLDVLLSASEEEKSAFRNSDRIAVGTADVADEVIHAMTNRALRRILKITLTPRERLALETQLEHLSLREASVILNLPVLAVNTMAKRALAKLAHPSVDIPSSLEVNGVGAWRQAAQCRDSGEVDFFPLPGGVYFDESKFICSLCPVARQCLQYAQSRNIAYGLWGGVGEKERRVMLRRSRQYVHQVDDGQQASGT